jgi:hypothetical protein
MDFFDEKDDRLFFEKKLSTISGGSGCLRFFEDKMSQYDLVKVS